MKNEIVTINGNQKDDYQRIDKKNSGTILKRYFNLIKLNTINRQISILDVGGGAGYFTKAVYDYLTERGFEVTAYVLDTMRYPNWNKENFKNIIFCEGSVEHVDTYFNEQKFDLIFCNKVFHHFITNTYSGTVQMLTVCMNKLGHQLSACGRLCILDYFYDGLLIDSFPSWMIYQCTSQKNGLLVRLFKKMGSKSAGSGVCFQSERMWRRLIEDCGLKVAVFERGQVSAIGIIKQIAFLSHKPVEDCIFICART